MSLKARVMLYLLGLLCLYGVLDYSVQRLIVLPEFEELEKRQARDDLQRSIHAIQREVEHLNSVCLDWASWDDTYQFVEKPGQEYIAGNLSIESYRNLEANIIYCCDLQGKVVWGKAYDLDTGREVHLADFPADALPMDHPLLKLNIRGVNLSDASISGVIITEKGPMLVASRPILQSNNVGPVRGTFIMGKFLDKAFVDRLVEQTKVSFSISRDPAREAALIKGSHPSIAGEFPYWITYRDRDLLDISTVYRDIRGRPAFLLENTMRRDIVKSGYEAMRYALLTLAAAGLFVAVLILFLMERTFLHPVTKLTRHVVSINETGNFSVRLGVNRSDEIGTLAREFDRMLGKIEGMNAMMEQINDRLIDDITRKQEMEKKLQAANRQLETLASVDGLTGLSNRRKFDEHLEIEWKRGIRDRAQLSLIIFDVDFFKLFNDTYGHQAGDDCLRSIAGVISSHARRVPDLAARYGGEEFALILPSTDLEGALHLAEDIRIHVRGLEILHEMSEADRFVTLSAGVSCVVPGKDSSREHLIRMADIALYEAKAKGRNRSEVRKES